MWHLLTDEEKRELVAAVKEEFLTKINHGHQQVAFA